MRLYAVLYDADGLIHQRMSGGEATIAATARALGLSVLMVPDDAAYERTHRAANGRLEPLPNGGWLPASS
jgi:hypothetical protein